MKSIIDLLIINCLLISYSSFGQTKIIAHKSHSGNSITFSKLLNSKATSLASSNYGVAPEPNVKTARLDSLIYVSKEISIMVTSEECSNRNGENAITKEWNYALQDWNKALSVSKDKKSSVWKAGRDTLYNHPLFSRNESLDSIKNVIRKNYFFRNEVSEIVFVGYSNKPLVKSNPKSYIIVKSPIIENGILNMELNGLFLSDGDCGANIQFGIEQQKNGSLEWENVLNITTNQMACGMPFVDYINQTIQFNIHNYWHRMNYNSGQKYIPQGKYRLFVYIYPTYEVIFSNEFYIK